MNASSTNYDQTDINVQAAEDNVTTDRAQSKENIVEVEEFNIGDQPILAIKKDVPSVLEPEQKEDGGVMKAGMSQHSGFRSFGNVTAAPYNRNLSALQNLGNLTQTLESMR